MLLSFVWSQFCTYIILYIICAVDRHNTASPNTVVLLNQPGSSQTDYPPPPYSNNDNDPSAANPTTEGDLPLPRDAGYLTFDEVGASLDEDSSKHLTHSQHTEPESAAEDNTAAAADNRGFVHDLSNEASNGIDGKNDENDLMSDEHVHVVSNPCRSPITNYSKRTSCELNIFPAEDLKINKYTYIWTDEFQFIAGHVSECPIVVLTLHPLVFGVVAY